ncbi:hypothetical protein GCM10009798_20710 [Nocardioides panacihumi]|uniref:GGDEF domain-containing protein n=1 Tax=Nocardioides panacihumi TaxID=400774 RepID=A0ABN2QZ89_9ACTN
MDAAEPTDLETFIASAQRVVDFLNSRTPLTDWSVSRVAGDEQVHLHVRGDTLLQVGDRVAWDETFCRRMLAGASQVVHDSQLDADYADIPAAVDVRAYAGVPILDGDGSLFGTLCGVRAEPLLGGEHVDKAMLDVFSELLSAQLVLVRSCSALHHAAVLAEAVANSDGLTGLMNRRGWDLLAAEAQERVDALGDQVGVLMIDLDDLKTVNDRVGHHAGDALIASAASALRTAARAGDKVARYGGDEFAVYVEDVAVADLDTVAARYADALAAVGVSASVGAAPVLPDGKPGSRLERALAEADASMYASKARKRAEAATRAEPR